MAIEYSGERIILPAPIYESSTSLEEALRLRRSVRHYSQDELSLDEVSQLLWAGQGITKAGFYRTSPSAGATYPLELYLVCGEVDEIPAGVYHYVPERHHLVLIRKGDLRSSLKDAALGQEHVGSAPAAIVVTAVYERTTSKYGERGIIYVHMEAGHCAQNILLQAESLDLGAVPVGAFIDKEALAVLDATKNESALYIIPLGRK